MSKVETTLKWEMYDLWTHFKVNVAIGKSAGTAFIQEVNVFNEETEERNHNLEKRDYGKFPSTSVMLGY